MRERVLVTGANGFVGKSLICHLTDNDKYRVRAVVRDRHLSEFDGSVDVIGINEISSNTDWSAALIDCDIVIHLAARVHVMNESATNPLEAYRQVNVSGTLQLAKKAAASGIRRFIFISSIKVNGETSNQYHPFTPDACLKPKDPYALSKYEAEQELLNLSKKTGMEVVIIRPPLVYGPAVKGNFQQMLRLLKKGYPLPFGAVHNKRSFVSILNLVDLIFTCVDHPNAAGQIFLVSDGVDLSTTELLTKMNSALQSTTRLIRVPHWILVVLGVVLGKRKEAQRLCQTLQVDMSKTMQLLNWKPVIGTTAALQETARYYLQSFK